MTRELTGRGDGRMAGSLVSGTRHEIRPANQKVVVSRGRVGKVSQVSKVRSISYNINLTLSL